MASTSTIEVNLYIDVEKGNDLNQIAQRIEDRLGQLEIVQEVETVPEKPRFTGLEVLGIISTVVLIADRSDDLIESLRKLVQSLKGLVQDAKELKDVFVEVGDKRVPIAEVNEETLQKLEVTTQP